jgi:hypothetical protein
MWEEVRREVVENRGGEGEGEREKRKEEGEYWNEGGDCGEEKKRRGRGEMMAKQWKISQGVLEVLTRVVPFPSVWYLFGSEYFCFPNFAFYRGFSPQKRVPRKYHEVSEASRVRREAPAIFF